MFPQKNRLSKEKDINNVFKRGRYSFAKDLGVKFLKNNFKHNRFTCIVSNKVSKKAVERNKIKRRLREIIRLIPLNLDVGIDLIVLTRPSVKELDYKETEKQIHSCFQRLGLISQSPIIKRQTSKNNQSPSAKYLRV